MAAEAKNAGVVLETKEPGKPATARKPRPAAPGRKRGDVRARILAAALDSFAVNGFEGTSTRAVAGKAGVNHTLVIYHFESKEKLWLTTVTEALNGYRDALNVHFGETAHVKPARTVLAAFIEQFVRMSASHPQIHRILTMESNQETPRMNWIIDHFIREHFTQVRDLIRRGQAEGSVRDCDAARLYYLIISTGGTPFTIPTEYRAMTGRDVFSDAEVLRIIAFIYEIVFKDS